MGKSSKPLTICVTDPAMLGWPEVQSRIAQGFEVFSIADMLSAAQKGLTVTPDIYLGPDCWRMDERTRKYFETAVTEARKIRYPK